MDLRFDKCISIIIDAWHCFFFFLKSFHCEHFNSQFSSRCYLCARKSPPRLSEVSPMSLRNGSSVCPIDWFYFYQKQSKKTKKNTQILCEYDPEWMCMYMRHILTLPSFQQFYRSWFYSRHVYLQHGIYSHIKKKREKGTRTYCRHLSTRVSETFWWESTVP